MTETWIEEKAWVQIEDKLPVDYKWKCNYAKRIHKRGRAIGGILTGIKKEIEEVESQETTSDNIQERKIKIDDEIWRIVTIYNNGKMKEIKNILTDIGDGTDENIMIGGDFNARTGVNGGIVNQMDGTEQKRKSKDKLVNKEGEILISMTEELGWTILNGNTENDEEGEYTYIGPRGDTVIDYIIVNEQALQKIEKFEIGTRVESDHQPLTTKIRGNRNQKATTDETEEKLLTTWTEETIRKYKTNLLKLDEEKEENTEAAMEKLIKLISEATTSRIIRPKTHNAVNENWWCTDCREKKKITRKALTDWRRGRGTKEEYKTHRKEYKELCTQKKKDKKEEERNNIRNIKSENDIWKYISGERKSKNRTSKLITMEQWENHFKKQLNGEDERAICNLQVERNDDIEEEITITEVKRQIAKLKKGKAAGEDGLQNEVWIYSTAGVVQKITEIINRIWQGKGLPKRWRKGVIIPIHKKGDREERRNYRGITLLDTSYKIYAMILQERLSAEIEEKGMLPDTQAGFRKGRSTIDNIYVLNYAIEKEIKKEGGKCYVLFADLKAAFDLVNRRKMIEMLRSRKVSEKLTNRIAEIYEETISVVRVNEKESSAFWTTMGVRQGCPLSPTLFALYLADIEEHMAKGQTGGLVIGKKKFWTLSYADDLVCVSKTQEEMKSLIKRLGTYLKKKDMILNTEKTKIMKFRKGGGRDTKEKWKWQQDDIESVKEFKYLGYTYKCNNTEDAHIKDITKRATIAMAQIWSIGERKFKHDIKLRMLLFDYTVKSILMYAAEIWGWKEQEKVENIQVKYLRWILGLEVHTPKYIVLEETKRNKLRVEAGKRAMKFEEKIRRNNNKEILFDCWNNIAKGDTQQGKWERKRAQFYERNGHATRDVENRRRLGQNIIEEIVNRDADIQRQEQTAKIDNARYNTRYKQLITIGLPRYMKKEQKSEGIKIIARFRCGNEENANMYWRKEEDRKCRLCKEEQETLEHLLTECEKKRDGAYRVEDVLDDSGKGLAWMRHILLERKKTIAHCND